MMRHVVSSALTRAGVEVVAAACDGDEALAACERERPDAMTLDLTMPGLDGLGVLAKLRERPTLGTPVVVVSAFSEAHGARAVDALAQGAFDLVPKPTPQEGLDAFAAALVEKVGQAAESRRIAASAGAGFRPSTRPRSREAKVVVIATSTGGPRALAAVLPQLPAPLGAGTLIVQHMPHGFTASLAERLNASSKLRVAEAAGGEILDPRAALIAPGGKHLRISAEGRTSLSEEDAIGGLRPRADLTIEDAARLFGDHLLLVVMTGMGNDGLKGAAAVRENGGRVLVEAPSSATVFGMPRAIAEAHLADDMLDLADLPKAIAEEAA